MNKNEITTGVHIEYWDNGNKLVEIPYVGEEFIKGEYHGVFTQWNEDGTKRTDAYYDNGEELVSTNYYPDGKVESRTYLLPHKNNGTDSGINFTKPHNTFRGERTKDTEHWISKTWNWSPKEQGNEHMI